MTEKYEFCLSVIFENDSENTARYLAAALRFLHWLQEGFRIRRKNFFLCLYVLLIAIQFSYKLIYKAS